MNPNDLPSCECIGSFPPNQKLDALYCVLAAIQAGGGGTGGTPVSDLPVATQLFPSDVLVGNVSDVTSQIPKNVATTFRMDLAADDDWDGIALKGTVSNADLAVGDVVNIGGSGWQRADSESGGIFPALGVVVEAALTGAVPTVMMQGVLRSNAHGLTGIVYLAAGPSGTLTSTPPSGSGEAVQSVGRVIDANHIYFNFNLEYVTLS